ncbi:MAG: ribonuclease P [Candidatus Woesearchaeota archaeon]
MPEKKQNRKGRKILHRKKPAKMRKIAEERIRTLFRQADDRMSKPNKDITPMDRSLANRYVTLARRIAMKYRVKIPPELKRKFCRHCYKYIKPGYNARVRVQKHRVIYQCGECGKYMRFMVKRRG